MNRIPTKPVFASRRHGRWARPGFSLAELMVAIGILGIGLLMVAATFPVGIEQTRAASYETMAPIIADEAFATLDLLLKDRSNRVIVPPGFDKAPYSVAPGAYNLGELVRTSLAYPDLEVGQVALRRGLPLTSANAKAKFDLNRWLQGKPQDESKGYVTVTPPSAPLGGVYPSHDPLPPTPSTYAPLPRYQWSVAYGAGALAGTVEWTVFVQRGSSTTDFEPIKVSRVSQTSTQVRVQTQGLPSNMSGVQLAAQLEPGTVLAVPDVTSTGRKAVLFPIVIRRIENDPTIELDRLLFPNLSVSAVPELVVYRVPPDPNTGVSPLLRKVPYRRASLLP